MNYKYYYYLKRILLILGYIAILSSLSSLYTYGGCAFSAFCLGTIWFVYIFSGRFSRVYDKVEWEKRATNGKWRRIKEYFEWEFPLRNEQKVYKLVYMIIMSIILIVYGLFCFSQGPGHTIKIKGGIYYSYKRVNIIEVIIFVLVMCWVFVIFSMEDYKKNIIKSVSRKKWNPFVHKGIRRRMADRFVCDLPCFKDINSRVEQISKKGNYTFWKYYEWNKEEYSNVYIREYTDKVAIDIIEIIQIPELQKNHIEMLQEHFRIMLKDYFGDLGIDTDLKYIYILCVDTVTPSFRELIDQLIVERRFKYYLPVGICFSKKEAYIPLMAGRTDLGEYLQLRSKVLKILYKDL